jgi:hypothetical protein
MRTNYKLITDLKMKVVPPLKTACEAVNENSGGTTHLKS